MHEEQGQQAAPQGPDLGVVRVGVDDVCPAELGQQGSDRVARDLIVARYHQNVITRRQAYALPIRIPQASIGAVMNHPPALVLRGQPIGDAAGTVTAAVVDDNDLIIGEETAGGTIDGLDGRGKIPLLVEGRDNEGERKPHYRADTLSLGRPKPRACMATRLW